MTMTVSSRTAQTPFSDWTDPRVQEAMNRTANEALSVLHINGGLVIRPRQTDHEPVEAQPLTDRERQVLALVAEGNSNKVIGDFLSISERTVKSHLTYIMTKLRASDRTHAVVTAVRLGWLAI
jgi:DNA-binding NarL/FixJ family response regulator